MLLFALGEAVDVEYTVEFVDHDEFVASTMLSQVLYSLRRIEDLLKLEVDKINDATKELELELIFHLLFLHYLCATINEWKHNVNTRTFIYDNVDVVYKQDRTLQILPQVYEMA